MSDIEGRDRELVLDSWAKSFTDELLAQRLDELAVTPGDYYSQVERAALLQEAAHRLRKGPAISEPNDRSQG